MQILSGFVDFDSGIEPDMRNPPSRPGRRGWNEGVSFPLTDGPPPTVTVAIRLMDHIQNPLNNLRYEIFAQEVSSTGCDIRLETWDDTRLAKVRVAWTAIFP